MVFMGKGEEGGGDLRKLIANERGENRISEP